MLCSMQLVGLLDACIQKTKPHLSNSEIYYLQVQLFLISRLYIYVFSKILYYFQYLMLRVLFFCDETGKISLFFCNLWFMVW